MRYQKLIKLFLWLFAEFVKFRSFSFFKQFEVQATGHTSNWYLAQNSEEEDDEPLISSKRWTRINNEEENRLINEATNHGKTPQDYSYRSPSFHFSVRSMQRLQAFNANWWRHQTIHVPSCQTWRTQGYATPTKTSPNRGCPIAHHW